MRFKRAMLRAGVTTGAVVALGLASAGPALAHFCYNEQRPDQANESVAKNSKGWFTVSQALPQFVPGCTADQYAAGIAAFEAAGGDADMPILAHAVLAQGVQVQIFEKGVDRDLPRPIANTNFAAFDALIGGLIGAGCTPPED